MAAEELGGIAYGDTEDRAVGMVWGLSECDGRRRSGEKEEPGRLGGSHLGSRLTESRWAEQSWASLKDPGASSPKTVLAHHK